MVKRKYYGHEEFGVLRMSSGTAEKKSTLKRSLLRDSVEDTKQRKVSNKLGILARGHP